LQFLDLVRYPVSKPARYLGAEYFPTGFRQRNDDDLAVCLAYPDVYEVGMSNSGISILYSILRRRPKTYADAAFCPWPDMECFLREKGMPLTSRHGNHPLASFDVLGFSLQYELTYANILTMLDLAGIPFYSNQRGDSHPVIIAGGPCATHPEPVAPFIDAFLVGDGEELVTRFLDLMQSIPKTNGWRERFIAEAAALPGVYVPLHGIAPVARQVVDDLDSFLPFLDFPVPALETIFDRLSLELARGCQGGCRFCEAGYTYRPPRERRVEALLQWVERALQTTGLEEVSLASLSTADYTSLSELVAGVEAFTRGRRTSFTVSSLRAYGLQPEVLDFLSRSRSSSLTLAPEAGSQRLRDVINKNVTENQILEAIHRAGHWGWNRLKLYFMLGLPTETHEDLEAIRRLAFSCMDLLKGRFGRKAELSLAFSLFVPRPHTPFQWEGMADLQELREKVDFIKRSLRRPGIELKWHSPHMSVLEGVLARGDRSVAKVVELAWRAGARFDSWEEHLRWPLWESAMEQCGISPATFLSPREIQEPLPWDHVDVGVNRTFLVAERARALEGATLAPCTPFAASGRICYACGANCAPPAKPALTQPPTAEPATTSAPEPSATHEPVRAHQRHNRHFNPGHEPARMPAGHLMVRWRKLGHSCLLGHLDTQRHMLLTLRRAGVKLAYTQGFHPRPRIVFPPALPLGYLALDEWMDVALEELCPTADLLEQLNALSLPDFEFLELGVLLPPQQPVDLAQPANVSYVVAFADQQQAQAALELLNSGTVPFAKEAAHATREEWWPHDTEAALLVRWAFQNAPRIDRHLRELLPDSTMPWVARAGLAYSRSPLQ